jgi:hypothetical protein
MSATLTSLEMALLDDAGAANDLSIAYGTVQLLERPEARDTLCDLTEAALLKLYDQGLIMFFRASRDEGYGADPSEVRGLNRGEIVAALHADRNPEYVPDETDLVFFVETEAGRELFEQLPSDALPKPSGHIERPWGSSSS